MGLISRLMHSFVSIHIPFCCSTLRYDRDVFELTSFSFFGLDEQR